MTDFKSAEDLLAAKDKAGIPRRRPEIQDETFWREKVLTAKELAEEGRIQGLVSWDPDLRRSFSADPVKDPFALTRTRFPTGKGSKLPRRIAYFLEPDTVPMPEPKGGVVQVKRPWRMVVLESQLLYEDLLPRKLSVPGSATVEAEPAVRRMPDDVRTEAWLHTSVGDALEASNFRALPVSAETLFSRPGQLTAVREAFLNVTILPADGLAKCTNLVFTSTDWNLPLSATPGGAMLAHVLKGRNTHVSVFIGQMNALGVRFTDGSAAIFRHREIYMQYETIVSLVTPDPKVPGALGASQRLEYSTVLRKDPVTGDASPLLKHVALTETAFSEPTSFLTMEVRGEFKKGTVGFHVTSKRLIPPPAGRSLLVVAADGTRRTVPFDAGAAFKALVADLCVVHDSMATALPLEIAKRLK
jgi:hypothetical protein